MDQKALGVLEPTEARLIVEKTNGVDIRTAKEWLGHSDIQTTMRYYAQQNVM